MFFFSKWVRISPEKDWFSHQWPNGDKMWYMAALLMNNHFWLMSSCWPTVQCRVPLKTLKQRKMFKQSRQIDKQTEWQKLSIQKLFLFATIFQIFIVLFQLLLFVAKLSPAQSNSNSVGWAEIALISTFTHPPPPPPGKVLNQASSIQLQLSLKPAWAELGTAQSQLVNQFSLNVQIFLISLPIWTKLC